MSVAVASAERVAGLFALQVVSERRHLRLLAPPPPTPEEETGPERVPLLDFATRVYPRFAVARHHRLIADHLEGVATGRIDRLIVVMPPRHGKSTLISELFPAWLLGTNPDLRVIGTSYAASLALRFSRHARNWFGAPGWPFPRVRVAQDLATVARWDVQGHLGGYVAAGVGGGIVGHGADVLVCDDPFRSAKDAASATTREAVWEWWQGTAYHRLEPGGAAIVVTTRWHEDDLVGRLLAAEAEGGDTWTVLHLPALDEAGRALWPERYGVADLERRRRAMGSRLFEALYQGRPSALSGVHYRRWWWRYWHHPGQPLPPVTLPGPGGTPVQVAPVPLPPTFDESLQSWDMTFRQTTEGSFVVGQVWGRVRANRYLLDQFRARVDFPATCLAVEAMAAKWPRVGRKLVENKANGPAVVAALRNRVPGLVEVEPEGGKEARALAATGVAEAGNVYLPHPMIAPWVDAFVEELAAFPAGATDDQVDAYSQAMARYEQGGGTWGGSYLAGPADGRSGGQTDAFGNDVPATNGRFAAWGRRP